MAVWTIHKLRAYRHFLLCNAETADLFQVSPATIYRWRQRFSLARTVVSQRQRKLDPEALRQHVRDTPGARLKDRAQVFGVHPSAISHALKRLGITVKKTVPLPPTEPSSLASVPSPSASVSTEPRPRRHH
ncbi:MAG: IS630 transposase-related protein [Elainellaceae cyanobacterium]